MIIKENPIYFTKLIHSTLILTDLIRILCPILNRPVILIV